MLRRLGLGLCLLATTAHAVVTVPTQEDHAAVIAAVAALVARLDALDARLETLHQELDALRARVAALEAPPPPPPPPPPPDYTPSGPLVATSGQTITRVRITGAPGDCIRVVGVTDVVIHDVQLEGCGGHAIRIDQAARIRVSNSLLVPRRTKTTLDSQHGVFATACADVLVQGNILRDFETGVEAMDCQSVTVKGNYSENPKGPFPRGQHVQFWRCNQNGPLERGCVADRNYYANTETEVHNGGAGQEDAINVGHSAHARITDNYLIGGRAASGCGVAFESAAHIYVARNVMVRTSQCGFNASNAAFALVEENKVLDTNLPSLSTGNIGLGAFYKTGQTGCHDNLYRNNVVSNLLPSGGYNDIWLKSGCGTQTNNTKGDAARALLLPEAEKLPPPPIPPLPWVP